MLNFIKNISPTELVILGSIVILLFGSKVFVALGKTMGESLREIKKVKKSVTEVVEDSVSTKDKKEVSK